MPRLVALTLVLVIAPALARAQPATDPAQPPTPANEGEPLRRSYPLMLAESAGLLAGMNIGARLLGKSYAQITLSSVVDNIRSDWVWDDDDFNTNQFGHPFQGTLYYQTARSNGFGILGSAIVTFADSLVWELAMETEKPSLNDQIITPAAGVLLGEALHRWSATLRYTRSGSAPGIVRTVLSTILEPLGTVNRISFGDAWRMAPPPPSFGYLAAGIDAVSVAFDVDSSSKVTTSGNLLHGALAFAYGVPSSPSYIPTKPFDYLDLRLEGSVSPSDYFATLRMRGLLYGWSYTSGSWLRGTWGAFGAYDFENPQRIRIGAASLGIGTTLHADLGDRAFVQATATGGVIPYGSAGGDVPGNNLRDYHRGPGSSQLVEVRLGYRGFGALRFTATGYEIDGERFQEGSEVLNTTRLEALWGLSDHNAIGLGADFGFRRAEFPDMPTQIDRSLQLRVFYALIHDRDFGGGSR